MNSGIIGTVVAALLGGGGAGSLIVGLLRHKGEARKLHTQADLNVVGIRDALIQRLQEDSDNYRGRVSELEAKVSRLEEKYERERHSFAEQLRVAHDENLRLTIRVAQLQTDLDIATRQIADLRQRGGT